MIQKIMRIKAIKKGLYNTVGLPHFGQQDVGISPGGAMDRFSLETGNAILGNPASAPALEVLFPPTLTFEEDGFFILTGATQEGATLALPSSTEPPTTIPHATVCFAPAGSVLSFGEKSHGFRTYLCFRRMDASARRDVLEGRSRGTFESLCTWGDAENKIRVVEGPEYTALNNPARFLGNAWRTTPEMSTMGMRLANDMAPPSCNIENMVSEAVSDGTIQLTPKGPIILLRHRQTVGGYPRILNVIGADLDRLAQYAPNQLMWFRKVSIEEAFKVAKLKHDALDQLKRGIK